MKKIMKCFLLAIIFILLLYFSTEVLKRKTIDGSWNYSIKIGGFSNVEENSISVMGFGSSHMYCSIVPSVMKEKYDLSTYILSTQQQSIKITYYYIVEALKRQKPEVVLLESYMIGRGSEYPEEAIVRDAVEFLPASKNKFDIINATVPSDERLEYYIPILKYHTRWKELEPQDFDFSYKDRVDPYHGYVYLDKVTEVNLNIELTPSEEYKVSGEDEVYLQKIIDLSKEFDFELVLLYAPFEINQDSINILYGIDEFAQENNLHFINGMASIDKLNLDETKDFFDRSHFNNAGATKFTEYVGEYIKDLSFDENQ